MSVWHMDAELARRYSDGDADLAVAASVEAHLIACADCRALLTDTVAIDDRLDAIWDSINAELDAPRRGVLERLLVRLGLRDDTARLLVTTPSLRLSWLTSLALALGLAGFAADRGDRELLLFLAIAPLAPLAGVAAAFGSLDATAPIATVTPYSHVRLLLVRTIAVLVTSIGLAALAGALLTNAGWWAAAWLLPALAMTSVTLALSARLDPTYAGGAVGLIWVAVVLGHAPLQQASLAPFSANAQLIYLLVTLAAGIVIAVTRTAFDYDRR